MEITRRDLMNGTLTLLGAGATLPLFSRTALAQAAASGAAPQARRLVLVQLEGGNDGINTVIPYRNSGYTRSRFSLRYTSTLR